MGKWLPQRGDSFDLATLLCSLLLGAGFDAYVAVGYAPRALALRSLDHMDCPWLAPADGSSGDARVKQPKRLNLAACDGTRSLL